MGEFLPGERITVPPSLVAARGAVPACRKWLCVKVPKRIGLSVKDMSTFAPGKPGGGGIGFSINLLTTSYVYVDSTLSTDEAVISCDRSRLISHHIAVFKALLRENGLRSDFFVAVVGNAETSLMHCGLGSTSSLVLGLYFGVNEALGSLFSREELRLLLAFNYVEEGAQPDTVGFGYETSMTGTGAVAGGMFVIDEHTLEVTARNVEAFGDKPVYVFLPDSDQRAPITADEEAALLTECGHVDSALSKDTIFNALKSELARGSACNLREVGDLVWQLQTLGSKRLELLKQPSGSRILSFMDNVRSVEGVLVTGMSSIGPAAVVLCEREIPRIGEIAGKCGLKELVVTKVNTCGAITHEEPTPELVCVVGPPCAGKSTWCEQHKAESGVHFSGGQFIREYVSSHSDRAAEVMRRIMEAGEVRDSDDVTTKTVLPEVYRLMSTSNSIFLDGIPRSVLQLECWLHKFATPITRLVAINAPLETRRARYESRKRENDTDFSTREMHDETEAMVALCRERGMTVSIQDS